MLDKIKMLDMFLNTIGFKKSKGKEYIITLLDLYTEPFVSINSIYKKIANIHNTTIKNVEFNIRYTKNQIKINYKSVFSDIPYKLTNSEFINELIIIFNIEQRNPNIINNKTW